MDLKNGYKVVYEKIADGTRTFYATTNTKCDPAVDDVIIEAEIGKYKLIYEKNGNFYGSETGIPADGDFCFETENFKKVFVEGYAAPAEAEDPTVTPNAEELTDGEATVDPEKSTDGNDELVEG